MQRPNSVDPVLVVRASSEACTGGRCRERVSGARAKQGTDQAVQERPLGGSVQSRWGGGRVREVAHLIAQPIQLILPAKLEVALEPRLELVAPIAARRAAART